MGTAYYRGAGGEAAGTDYTSDANCQGAWFMNCSGNETDRSGNGNTLTETSGTIPTSATVPSGYSGTSRDFELGDTECLLRTDGDSVGLDINGADAKVSVVAWVKAEDIANASWYSIACKWTNQYYLGLVGTGSGTFKVAGGVVGGAGQKLVYSTGTAYAAGTWYHVAFVFNDVDLRVYTNGSLDCTPLADTNGISDNASSFYIGSSSTGSPFDGLIDEVAVFDRELSSTEVAEIYTDGIDGTKGGND